MYRLLKFAAKALPLPRALSVPPGQLGQLINDIQLLAIYDPATLHVMMPVVARLAAPHREQALRDGPLCPKGLTVLVDGAGG